MHIDLTYTHLWEYNRQAEQMASQRNLHTMFHYQNLDRFFHNNKANIKTMMDRLVSKQRHCCEGEDNKEGVFIPKVETKDNVNEKGEVIGKIEEFIYKSEELHKEYDEFFEKWKDTPVKIIF